MNSDLRTLRGRMLLAALLGGAPAARAMPMTETVGRMEMNWSSLRLRYYGEALATPVVAAPPASAAAPGEEAYKAAERRARQDGMTYVADAVRDLHVAANPALAADKNKLVEDGRDAARQVSAASSSYDTTYFGDGTVRVRLEAALPLALESGGISFQSKGATEPAENAFTGVVIRTDKALKPRATYQIVDESGATLFAVGDMTSAGYRKNLMGRWFKRPSAAELSQAVGASPLQVDAHVEDRSGAKLVVKRADWDSAAAKHLALLANGRIALALP